MDVSDRRILALWFPRLPTDRLQRRCASPDEIPLIISRKEDNALCLYAVDAKAAKLKLAPGMPLADARARIPALNVVEADEPADAKLLNAIADWCERYTPLVALDSPHGLLLDVTGATHLFDGEKALLDQIRKALTKLGFAVRGAIAGSAAAARALAHYADGTIAPPQREAETIAPLPIAALNLDYAITHGLRRAGLKTIGQVASRTRPELTSRFGKQMVFLLDHALGKIEKPISPRRAMPDFLAEHRFAEPIATQDVIEASISSLAQNIAAMLEKHGQGARRMEAAFFRADGAVHRIAIETGAPVREPKIVERLFHERLDSLHDPLDPGFGFDLIRLCADKAERMKPETIGFDANDNIDKEIAFLTDRLSARFGSHRVLRFQPQDTHIPEAEAVTVPAQQARSHSWKRGETQRRPLRLFAKPEPIEAMAEVPDGPPLRFRWRRALHSVARAEGPERIAMEWWRHQEAMPTRDYFRVEDKDGRRFWLYRDGLYGRDHPRWFVHGVFA
jgi:protein ImuB